MKRALTIVFVLLGIAAAPATASAAEATLLKVKRACYVDEAAASAEIDVVWGSHAAWTDETPEAVGYVAVGSVSCVEFTEPIAPRVDVSTRFDVIRQRPSAEGVVPDHLALAQCGGRGLMLVAQYAAPGRTDVPRPTGEIADVHRTNLSTVLDACIEAAGLKLPSRNDLGFLGAFGTGGPAPTSLSCAGNSAANPYAAGSGWPLVGNAAFTVYELVRKNVVSAMEWDVKGIGRNFAEYDVAQELIKQDFADLAASWEAEDAKSEAAKAKSAWWDSVYAQFYRDDEGAKRLDDPDVQKHMDAAAEARDAAATHAAAAQRHADEARAATTLKEKVEAWDWAQQERQAAESDRKKAEEEARRAQDEAAKKRPEGTTGISGDGKPSGAIDQANACGGVRLFLWECRQAGWKTGPCQDFLRKLSGRCADYEVIDPLPDEDPCAAEAPRSEEVMAAAWEVACGLHVAQPVPGENPCPADAAPGFVFTPLTCTPSSELICTKDASGVLAPCDDTVASSDGHGCATVDPIKMPKSIYCPPAPPNVPPPPCVEVEPFGPGPLLTGQVVVSGVTWLEFTT